MRFISIQFITLACMLFVMAAQAKPNNQATVNGERGALIPATEWHVSPAASVESSEKGSAVKEADHGSGRYGIGFDARQGIGSDVQGNRDEHGKRGVQ